MVIRDFLLVSACSGLPIDPTLSLHTTQPHPFAARAHMAGNGSFNNGYSHYDQSVAAWSQGG